MAAAATSENISGRIERYLQLASEFDARAQRESDPEIRVDLYNTVVQFMMLADGATGAQGEFDSGSERARPRGVFNYRRSRLRVHPLTRAAASVSARMLHTNTVTPKILKIRKGSRPAPHPERGILSSQLG